MGEVKPPTEGLPKTRSKVDMENDAMSDEGIGDPMLRASEAWHSGDWPGIRDVAY